jgi:hypothetical protein
MKEGLLYTLFAFLVFWALSLPGSGDSVSYKDSHSCSSNTSTLVASCSLPETVIFLKKFSFSQLFSGIFHRNLFESIRPDQIRMPLLKITGRNKRPMAMDTGQKILLLLISNKSTEDDHHLWNK